MTDALRALEGKIADRSANLAVIGLGYVGLPVACLLASKGFRVTGIDVKQGRVDLINAGRSPIEGEEPGLAELLAGVVRDGQLTATLDYELARQADAVFLNVETPVEDHDHRPAYRALEAACRGLAGVLQRGALAIVESTIAPGTMSNVVQPLLEEGSGLRAGQDFFLGHCPERVMPGKLLNNLRTMSRICGGSTPQTAQLMVQLYGLLVEADLDTSDCVTAEIVKTAENAYRDVNIAFANELALVCEANGGDFWRVRDLVNKSPGRNVLFAGPGVGGHCIPKDPWLLAHSAPPGAPLRLVPTARTVNDGMPAHALDLVRTGLERAGRGLSGARVAVMGFAYLENSDDDRNSPSAALVLCLRQAGADVVIQDPYVKPYQQPASEALGGADAAIFMVAHREYFDLDPASLRRCLRSPVLVDGRNIFDADRARAAGLIYLGIGKGS